MTKLAMLLFILFSIVSLSAFSIESSVEKESKTIDLLSTNFIDQCRDEGIWADGDILNAMEKICQKMKEKLHQSRTRIIKTSLEKAREVDGQNGIIAFSFNTPEIIAENGQHIRRGFHDLGGPNSSITFYFETEQDGIKVNDERRAIWKGVTGYQGYDGYKLRSRGGKSVVLKESSDSLQFLTHNSDIYKIYNLYDVGGRAYGVSPELLGKLYIYKRDGKFLARFYYKRDHIVYPKKQ